MGTTQNKLVTSHQYNKRNKQAVQVLNKVEYDSDGNPIGLCEDPSNPASANFGTPREPRRGGCYRGDGSSYITIPGLLSTDTVEVFDGSDMPTISNGRLDIASGDRVFGVKIFRAGELWAKYNCSENSGNICYDSSGNGNHGTIINAITTTPEENPNSIHQYQDVYSFENEEGYSESGNVIIPKNSSITLPPFKDVLGNNLQYVGKVPGKSKFVNSSCFLSDGNAYLSGDVLTTDTITAHPESEAPVCTTDGRLDFPVVGGKYFNITIERGGSVIARLPLCEPIIDPSNHIYHDVSGNGNHATLVNGTLANEGKQDKFHYLQKGLVKRSTGATIPILEDESGFVDGSSLDDVDAIPQDYHSFLNTGTELEAYDYPELRQADKDDNFWYIGNSGPRRINHMELAIENLMSDKIFLDITDKNI